MSTLQPPGRASPAGRVSSSGRASLSGGSSRLAWASRAARRLSAHPATHASRPAEASEPTDRRSGPGSGPSSDRADRLRRNMPARPTRVRSIDTMSTGVRPYVRVASGLVGTTTIRFGVTRHGPAAPSASQLGKNEVRTMTGTPMRSTWNEMESTSATMSVTCTGSSARSSGSSPAGRCCHAMSPPTVHWTAWEPSWKTSTDGSSQPEWSTSVNTTGSKARGATRSDPSTRNTVHGPVVATSVRSGWSRASLMALCEDGE